MSYFAWNRPNIVTVVRCGAVRCGAVWWVDAVFKPTLVFSLAEAEQKDKGNKI